jgi:integrase
VFQTRKSTTLSQENLRNRVLAPLLKRLGIAHAGLHAFRHARCTQLRRQNTPGDLQRKRLGHSSLRTGDRYSHVREELEFRRAAAGEVGLDRVLGPKQSQTHHQNGNSDRVVKR